MPRAPVYSEIKKSLLEDIARGVYPEGSRLTPEVELAQRFGVSRPTVRQAILELVREGVLTRRRGQGTAVLPGRIGYPVGRLMSFSEEFASSGNATASKIVAQELIRADADLAVRLGAPVASPVFRLERIRYLDRQPIAWQRSHISQSRVPGIETVDFSRASLYATLRERFRIDVVSADEVIRASAADKAEAALLEIEAGSPIFRIERRGFAEGEELVELVDSIYRSDRYEIRLVLKR